MSHECVSFLTGLLLRLDNETSNPISRVSHCVSPVFDIVIYFLRVNLGLKAWRKLCFIRTSAVWPDFSRGVRHVMSTARHLEFERVSIIENTPIAIVVDRTLYLNSFVSHFVSPLLNA